MQQKITGFYQDDQGFWVADLSCGHSRHVRHDPPWQSRPWIETAAGRAEKLGLMLECEKCDEQGVLAECHLPENAEGIE